VSRGTLLVDVRMVALSFAVNILGKQPVRRLFSRMHV